MRRGGGGLRPHLKFLLRIPSLELLEGRQLERDLTWIHFDSLMETTEHVLELLSTENFNDNLM